MAATWNDILTDALIEAGVFGPGEPIPDSQMSFAVRKCGDILDEWAARKAFAYNVNFGAFTLTPNHQPHTIGPGGDFNVAARPVRIEAAALILNTSTPNVDVPLRIRDDDWWAGQRVKSITSSVPTDLYYSPDFPLGSLYLWPVPTAAYGLRLETWVQLALPVDGSGDPDITQDFTAPPAYRKAVKLTLAEELCDVFGRPLPATLAQRAARARYALQSNNAKSPRTASADLGTRGRSRGGFNWMNGQ